MTPPARVPRWLHEVIRAGIWAGSSVFLALIVYTAWFRDVAIEWIDEVIVVAVAWFVIAVVYLAVLRRTTRLPPAAAAEPPLSPIVDLDGRSYARLNVVRGQGYGGARVAGGSTLEGTDWHLDTGRPPSVAPPADADAPPEP